MASVLKLTRPTEETLGNSTTIYLNIWIYFNLIGNTILLPLIVLTFLFSKTAKRHPILINLCMTWIFSGVFSLLLFYKRQHVGPEPDLYLCIAQASLLPGIAPMWSVAVLEMIYYMLHTSRGPHLSSRWKGLPLAIVLSAPYIVHCSFTIGASLLALRNPDKVSRHLVFCVVQSAFLFLIILLFTLAVCVIIIILEVALAMIIYRSWRTRRSAGLPRELPVPVIVRMFVFVIYVMIGLVVDILTFFKFFLPGQLFAATSGTVIFLIFGTQGDVFRAWRFWGKNDDSGFDPATGSLQPNPSLEIQSSSTNSLGAIFMSPRSSQRFSWHDRPIRQPVNPSPQSHRSSAMTFVRSRDR
ncbi:hypothetical protein AGABI2DRAFT_122647 [Agaricus bisporus var. bisporus H97]|uniref:hypothetical protein n=1 Tax=Agaricus bisporus var. bisporus (strain H97 / ATCC MYA-4626 / FGSC 10389) TaxID=936046 RepID=UPI00029F52B8|nr:hypothetical protein AGABI2DRAFT_122647 [Agaricus bisporus var. bisporus H97]EKV42420.1 hypothetical protein AGABI2DRAFT_122647 [Agaricus bisporus var. bisporus H97]